MKISWVLLTYNRLNSVKKAITHCMNNAEYPWHEIIHVDNGSVDGVREWVKENCNPAVSIYNKENLGVAKGYNRGMALVSGDFIVITGCDVLMPDGWLLKMADCFKRTPQTGIVTIYCEPIEKTPERIRGPEQKLGEITIRPAMPIGRRLMRTDLQREIGYFHEGFGLYGWDDVVWGYRAEKVCLEKGMLFYNLPNLIGEHLGTEGSVGYDHKDPREYWEWKRKQVNDPLKHKLMSELSIKGYPKYDPY